MSSIPSELCKLLPMDVSSKTIVNESRVIAAQIRQHRATRLNQIPEDRTLFVGHDLDVCDFVQLSIDGLFNN